MADLIDRQAVIEAVNGVIAEYIPTLYGRYEALPLEMAMAIKRLPTAEPIIRCGECKHNYADGDNVRFNVCELMHNKVHSDDWYCADAERRSDG